MLEAFDVKAMGAKTSLAFTTLAFVAVIAGSFTYLSVCGGGKRESGGSWVVAEQSAVCSLASALRHAVQPTMIGRSQPCCSSSAV